MVAEREHPEQTANLCLQLFSALGVKRVLIQDIDTAQQVPSMKPSNWPNAIGPDPLFHPSFIHDPLKDEVLRYANWALSWNAKRTYTSGEKRFISFWLMNRLTSPTGDILPASEGTHLFYILFSSHSLTLHNQNVLSSRQESTYSFRLQWPLTGQAAFKKDFKGHSSLPGLFSYKSSAGHPPGPVSYPSRPWELVGCSGFFHDLGCIYASLFRLSSL